LLVKLSAPYESSASGAPASTMSDPEARHLAKTFPERMLWATNWPHPGQKKPLSHTPRWTADDWVETSDAQAHRWSTIRPGCRGF
jgi:D-galactarolactone isomerase